MRVPTSDRRRRVPVQGEEVVKGRTKFCGPGCRVPHAERPEEVCDCKAAKTFREVRDEYLRDQRQKEKKS